ncbi:MAG: hypothetical protein Q4F07_00375 [Bacteroidales bacterium]|nr:hypothetical protein [Bacteroidales bacterium]
MKKLSFFLVALTAVLGLSSCEDEKKPVFHEADASKFEVYEPALQNQYYELTTNGTLEIVVKSAPDYGAPMGPTTYGAVVSLDPSFANTAEVSAENNSSRIMLKESEISEAICKLSGLTKDDAGYVFPGTVKVYLKATCEIASIPGSKVTTSNYCTLNKVMPYFAIPSPNFIYLVGQPEGWSGPSPSNVEHYSAWRLFEKDEEIGSNVYYGTFQVNQGEAMFRFYTTLTNWDTDSYGAQTDDNPVDETLDANNAWSGKIMAGKGAFNFPTWPGGLMTICVDLNAMTISVAPAEAE